MDPQTAAGSYGFNAWTPAAPGGVAIMPETNVGVSGNIPGAALPKLPLTWHNPLFWVLAFALIFTGYLYGGFDIGLKKIGSLGIKAGR
jgi:hypothetical protein